MNKPRKFLAHIGVSILLSISTGISHGQGQFAGVELSIVPVAGSVYMVQRPGGGGNIGVFVGPEGVLLVDSLFAPLSDKLVAVVGEVTDEEIRFLINTHIHIDHVGGNENLAEMGVLIFAHDNTHHALAMAYAAADCLTPDGFDSRRWAEHRDVFNTHVVED